jgi:hypothetical protein
MTDYELKKLQERRLEMLQNGFYYFAVTLGTIVIILNLLMIVIK